MLWIIGLDSSNRWGDSLVAIAVEFKEKYILRTWSDLDYTDVKLPERLEQMKIICEDANPDVIFEQIKELLHHSNVTVRILPDSQMFKWHSSDSTELISDKHFLYVQTPVYEAIKKGLLLIS